jgi:hypothetical protein
VKNLVAFNARYGDGLPVAGQYRGSLDNGGERANSSTRATKRFTTSAMTISGIL